jgi:hypothetical protein
MPELREEAARFDVDFAALAIALNGGSGFDGNNRVITEADVALVRGIAPELELYRSRWRALNQPANTNQLSSEMLLLARITDSFRETAIRAWFMASSNGKLTARRFVKTLMPNVPIYSATT